MPVNVIKLAVASQSFVLTRHNRHFASSSSTETKSGFHAVILRNIERRNSYAAVACNLGHKFGREEVFVLLSGWGRTWRGFQSASPSLS